MTFWKWSRTAASNGTADSTINMAEGMAPSAVNDGGRGVMAAAAKYRDDMSGAIAAGGTANALTVTSYQSLTSLTDGFTVAFRVASANTGSTTLAVDGLTAKPLREKLATNLLGGELRADTIRSATYNSSDESWLLREAHPRIRIAAACYATDNSGTPTIQSSFNVSSITDVGTGSYRVNFTTALPSVNYIALCTLEAIDHTVSTNGKATTYCPVLIRDILQVAQDEPFNLVCYVID